MADNRNRTLWCGNLSDKVTEDILYELFLQAGPLENVSLPKNNDGSLKGYAFITFKHPISVPYTVALMSDISLYGKALKLDVRKGTETEHNPYLEKLSQYRNCSPHQGQMYNRNYNSYQRDQYDDNSRRGYDSRRYDSRGEVQRRNPYPGPPPPPFGGQNATNLYGSPMMNQGRYQQNSMPQVAYPLKQYGPPWPRNHR